MRFLTRLLRFDWILMLAMATLIGVGLIVMYGIGISRPEGDLFLFYKHLVGAGIGLCVLITLGLVDYRQFRGLAFVAYGLGVLLLFGVLLFGDTIRGTRGWYTFYGLSFQPVEMAKLCLIVFLASYLSRFTHRALPWHVIVGSLGATLGYVALIMLQPDFGSAMVMLALWGAFLLFVGIGWKTVLSIAGATLITVMLLWAFVLAPYQKNRLMAFIDPSRDVRGAGYNVTQAQIAIGSGGMFGKGIGEGSQARLRFLPEAATDFSFAVVGEELGFVGITFVLGVFALLFYRLYMAARLSEDDFAALLIFGIGTFLLVHVTVNVGMNLGVMPVTGIPLPFLSAASSYLLAAMVALGIVQSIAVRRRSAG